MFRKRNTDSKLWLQFIKKPQYKIANVLSESPKARRFSSAGLTALGGLHDMNTQTSTGD